MHHQLGTLSILPVSEHLDLVAASVAKALPSLPMNYVGVAKIDPGLSDTAAFCEHYKIGMSEAANCVILEAKRGDREWPAACVVLGSTRADVNGLARKALDARRVSFASMEKAVSATEMEYGAITPIGLPPEWPILIDKAVADAELIVIGSGIRSSKLIVPGGFLAALPCVQVLENLGRTASTT